jgi:hypothetical protein
MALRDAEEGSECEDSDDECIAGEEARADAPVGSAPGMSASHMTGVAKLPNVLDWLRHALGSGGGRRDGSQDSASKFLIFAHHRCASLLLPSIYLILTPSSIPCSATLSAFIQRIPRITIFCCPSSAFLCTARCQNRPAGGFLIDLQLLILDVQ